MVMHKAEQLQIKALITEAITILCKKGLSYRSKFSVEGLLGITLDDDDILLVSVHELVQKDEIGSSIERQSGTQNHVFGAEQAVTAAETTVALVQAQAQGLLQLQQQQQKAQHQLLQQQQSQQHQQEKLLHQQAAKHQLGDGHHHSVRSKTTAPHPLERVLLPTITGPTIVMSAGPTGGGPITPQILSPQTLPFRALSVDQLTSASALGYRRTASQPHASQPPTGSSSSIISGDGRVSFSSSTVDSALGSSLGSHSAQPSPAQIVHSGTGSSSSHHSSGQHHHHYHHHRRRRANSDQSLPIGDPPPVKRMTLSIGGAAINASSEGAHRGLLLSPDSMDINSETLGSNGSSNKTNVDSNVTSGEVANVIVKHEPLSDSESETPLTAVSVESDLPPIICSSAYSIGSAGPPESLSSSVGCSTWSPSRTSSSVNSCTPIMHTVTTPSSNSTQVLSNSLSQSNSSTGSNSNDASAATSPEGSSSSISRGGGGGPSSSSVCALHRQILEQSGCIIFASSVVLQDGTKTHTRTNGHMVQAMQEMTYPLGHPRHVGQYKEVMAGRYSRKVFYKCPPEIIRAEVLSAYGLSLKVYTKMFYSDVKPVTSSSKWFETAETLMLNFPYGPRLFPLQMMGLSEDQMRVLSMIRVYKENKQNHKQQQQQQQQKT